MRFWIFYPDDTRELLETYSPDVLGIKVMQLLFAHGGDLLTQRVQAISIIAHLLFEGKAQYPHGEDAPLFTIVNEKP